MEIINYTLDLVRCNSLFSVLLLVRLWVIPGSTLVSVIKLLGGVGGSLQCLSIMVLLVIRVQFWGQVRNGGGWEEKIKIKRVSIKRVKNKKGKIKG